MKYDTEMRVNKDQFFNVTSNKAEIKLSLIPNTQDIPVSTLPSGKEITKIFLIKKSMKKFSSGPFKTKKGEY